MLLFNNCLGKSEGKDVKMLKDIVTMTEKGLSGTQFKVYVDEVKDGVYKIGKIDKIDKK